MGTMTIDDIRGIVKDENQHVKQTVDHLIISIDKMTKSIVELASHNKVNAEKFIRVYDKIEEAHLLAGKTNDRLLTLATDTIPKLESKVTLNSFSADKIWKIAIAVTVPLIGCFWALVERSNAVQTSQIKAVTDSLKLLATSLAN